MKERFIRKNKQAILILALAIVVAIIAIYTKNSSPSYVCAAISDQGGTTITQAPADFHEGDSCSAGASVVDSASNSGSNNDGFGRQGTTGTANSGTAGTTGETSIGGPAKSGTASSSSSGSSSSYNEGSSSYYDSSNSPENSTNQNNGSIKDSTNIPETSSQNNQYLTKEPISVKSSDVPQEYEEAVKEFSIKNKIYIDCATFVASSNGELSRIMIEGYRTFSFLRITIKIPVKVILLVSNSSITSQCINYPKWAFFLK